jgi:ABC-type nitrate/sulfonate/bicarbonate transport system ATPase subunit
MSAPKIHIADLRKSFWRHGSKGVSDEVLKGIDLTIRDREFVCILGASGCGKSTLLNILAALDRDYSGEVAVGGEPPGGKETRIGYLFQEDRLLPWRTAEQNIDFALRAAAAAPERWEAQKARYLEITGLSAFRKHYPHQLSGGMRQRLALARALAIEPDIMLMDEPFSGLDELTARRLRTDILDIWQQSQKTIVFVTHNSYEACFLADRIVIMAAGRVCEEIDVHLPRPRDYDDPEIFAMNRDVVRKFIAVTSERESPVRPDKAAIR